MSNKESRSKKAKNQGSQHHHFVIPRRGLTLIEMLIGMAITLVMMAAVVTLFANIGSGIRVQRAAMEMSSQLRTTRARLFKDLAGATCAPRPKLPTDDHDDGYIEIVEGQWSDKAPSVLLDGIDNATNPELDYTISQVPSGGDPAIVLPATGATGVVTNGRALGDYDDILALTVRSDSEPFVGRGLVFNTTTNTWEDETVQSNLAEVIWFAIENPVGTSPAEPGMRTIYRRMLLITPWLGAIDPSLFTVPMTDFTDPIEFFNRFGISAHFDPTSNKWIPNSLPDLVKRENRYGHYRINFPHNFPHIVATGAWALPGEFGSGSSVVALFDERQGEDLMLNDALAFDVRVFDPNAPIMQKTSGVVVEPSDAGYVAAGGLTTVGQGAYVDLYYTPSFGMTSDFSDIGNPRAFLPLNSAGPLKGVYDTWSYHYETDNIDQDNGASGQSWRNIADEGTNGLDDDGNNGVDDAGERETSPPYNVPLRGIQVKLRVYEPDTRQIREATVTRGFVPQ